MKHIKWRTGRISILLIGLSTLMGVSYAQWNDTLDVHASVSSGCIDLVKVESSFEIVEDAKSDSKEVANIFVYTVTLTNHGTIPLEVCPPSDIYDTEGKPKVGYLVFDACNKEPGLPEKPGKTTVGGGVTWNKVAAREFASTHAEIYSNDAFDSKNHNIHEKGKAEDAYRIEPGEEKIFVFKEKLTALKEKEKPFANEEVTAGDTLGIRITLGAKDTLKGVWTDDLLIEERIIIDDEEARIIREASWTQ